MVVLAASIVTKTGKALVSRQYMDMSRIRIEGLLAAFPKLVGTGKQHTYVETENVRYVFQPMEGLYLLLVTNKQSNILEDLETLRMLSKIVPEFAGSPDEDAICRAAFDLIFAFDEVIAQGHKENITVQQVKQNCEMESHEEKLHKMIIQSKINDTKDLMKRKAMEIEKTKMESRKMGGDKGLGNFIPGGISGFNAGGTSASSLRPAIDDVTPSFAPTTTSSASRPAAKKGMQLGKAKGAASILETLAKEGESVDLDLTSKPTPSTAATAAANISAEPVFINIEEKLFVTLNKEGGLEAMEVQGTMSLVVKSEEDAYVKVAISSGANKGFQFKTHPNIDKGMYTSGNVLGLKDPSRPFPTGSELGILKWRMATREEELVPLTINCWPSVSGGESYVNIEYESNADYDLQHVTIAIPASTAPTVNQVDGDWRYDSRAHALLWTIELIDRTNSSGSLEFVVPAADPESFYPVEVSFTSPRTLCEVEIEAVLHSQQDTPVKYGTKKQLQTAQYQVL